MESESENGVSFMGSNRGGQCVFPDGTTPSEPTAASSALLQEKIIGIVAGALLTLCHTTDGGVLGVGTNVFGQLGRGHSNGDDPDNRVPRPIPGLKNIAMIAAGYSHCCAVTKDGEMFAWGRNIHGQCGRAPRGNLNVLAATRCDSGALKNQVRVAFVACGGDHTLALTINGNVIAFGVNNGGQLGTGNNHYQPTPERLTCAALVGVRIVGCAAGARFTQLVSDDGRVFATGYNDHGQLGTGDMTHVNTPTEIDAAHFGAAPVAAVACGYCHTMAITRGEGKLYCWGQGGCGATGLGHTDDATTPQPVVGALADARVVRIAVSWRHSFVLVDDGNVLAFGDASNDLIGIPQLLNLGALAGKTVRALGSGCCAQHLAFIEGPPPAEPDFEFGVIARTQFRKWLRRRVLLLCLLRAAQRGRAGGGEAVHLKRLHSSSGDGAAATAPATASGGGGDTPLIFMALLPEDLWKGPLIFQFL